MTDHLLRAEHLYRCYGDECAVEDVSFAVGRGEVLGLLGLNGAGKSTTLRMLSGNQDWSAGRVLIGGLDLSRHPLQARKLLGYLPDQPPLYPDLTVDEYLGYVGRLHGLRRGRLSESVTRAKGRCGLTGAGRKLIGQLSKGYQQRVGVAQAIVHNPEVVLLDEPTVGLDPAQIVEIRELIRELGRDHALVLSSHLLSEVEAVCSRVLILHKGRVAFAERLATLHPAHATRILVSFGHPPAADTLQAIAGVARVEEVQAGRFRLHLDDTDRARQELVQQAAALGWGLAELIPEHKSLEQTFIELTCRDPADAAREAA